MSELTVVEQLGKWVASKRFEDLSQEEIVALKGRVLDAIGCAIGALDSTTIKSIQKMTHDLTQDGSATLIGGGKTTPDYAALFNGAAIRYLDYNDSYLAKGETCHPSDNISAILAATEHNGGTGKDFLLGLAIAYHVQCRLSDEAPVRKHGFDHTVQEAYGAAAGAAKALGLDEKQIANAVAISGTSYNSLRVTRTGALSNWKGLAAPNTARGAMSSALLAKYHEGPEYHICHHVLHVLVLICQTLIGQKRKPHKCLGDDEILLGHHDKPQNDDEQLLPKLGLESLF